MAEDGTMAKHIALLFTIAKTWKHPNAHRQMNGSRICGTYIQWNITQP